MLQPFFFIAENFLEGAVISKEMGPLIGLLFVVKDRGVRAALLNKVSLMTQHLDKNTLNVSVFEPLCSGFSDSSSALRELTLKATLVLVPTLNQPNLEKLSRYLIRMQSDSETSIRTNTVIFISKLAPHLSESSQQKLLLPAFVRAMKDPFSPCRMAALQTTLKSKDNFKMLELATKLMPAVSPLLLDPMEDVRKEAFSVVDTLLATLRTESDRMAHIARREAAQQAQARSSQTAAPNAPNSAPAPAPSVAPSPASGSYLSGLSSWVAGSTKASDGPAVAAAPASGPSPQMSRTAPAPVPVRPAAPAPPVQQFSSMGMSNNLSAAAIPADGGWGDEDDIDTDTDGWGDDMDDGLGNLSASSGFKNAGGSSLLSNKPVAAPAPSNLFSADMDDPFASIGAMPARKIAPRSGGSGGKLILPKKATAIKKSTPIIAPATKLSIKDDDVGDGWDDF
jgi:SCY1-like protein 1